MSATTYPLVMALNLFESTTNLSSEEEEVLRDGKAKLHDGYKKLLHYETSKGGYEWFGQNPGHEALTAYGIMQFFEMRSHLADVDNAMINRNKGHPCTVNQW